jgi:crossover junction endodeoxyribonuclease RuvC
LRDGWLAKGKLQLLAGQPGTGKTTLALALAAITSIGGVWPDGSRPAPGNVVIWSGEDDPRDTLVPRLIADDRLPPNLRGLISRPCPDGFAPQRWAVLCEGVERFAQEWAAKAMSLGWTFEELFALRDPFANGSLQGAAWFIGGSTLTAVTADAITLRTQSGATLRAYRRSEPGDEELRSPIAFLEAEVADGAWHNSFNLEARADAVGITIENLARARHKLGVESRQWPGSPRKWRLPDGGGVPMTSSTIVGVDTGTHGAIAILDETGQLLGVEDMPTTPEANGRTATNAPLLAGLLVRAHARVAYCEFTGARPTDARTAAFAFGRARGVIEGCAGALGLPIVFLTPPVWKRIADIPAGLENKDLARTRAIARWPAQAELFARKCDVDRTEACLIALAGLRPEARNA